MSLTPPASPNAASDDSPETENAVVASPIANSPVPAEITAIPALAPGESNVASTPIAAPFLQALASPAIPPLPSLSFSLDTPAKTVTYSTAPLSPPLSDDDDQDDDENDHAETDAHDGLGDTWVEETPKRQAETDVLPLPGSPQSVAAELVTTSPHFIGASLVLLLRESVVCWYTEGWTTHARQLHSDYPIHNVPLQTRT